MIVKEETISEPLSLTVSLRGTREIRDDYQLVHLIGQLDAFSEPTFSKVVNGCLDSGPKQMILILTQIDFIDSSGLGALVRLAKNAQNEGGRLQIVTNPRVTQTVKLVRLEKFLSLQPSLEVALSGLKDK